jgi:hypothetical protein
MLHKKVYVNDQPIGDARTWTEVAALIKSKGILFLGTPGAAEGPTEFYVSGTFERHSVPRLRKTDEIA